MSTAASGSFSSFCFADPPTDGSNGPMDGSSRGGGEPFGFDQSEEPRPSGQRLVQGRACDSSWSNGDQARVQMAMEASSLLGLLSVEMEPDAASPPTRKQGRQNPKGQARGTLFDLLNPSDPSG